MRPVGILSYAQTPYVRSEIHRNEVEMLMPLLEEARAKSGLERDDIGFTVSGSSDYIAGQAFAFGATRRGMVIIVLLFIGSLSLLGAGLWGILRRDGAERPGAWRRVCAPSSTAASTTLRRSCSTTTGPCAEPAWPVRHGSSATCSTDDTVKTVGGVYGS